jgi:hypothetical protein
MAVQEKALVSFILAWLKPGAAGFRIKYGNRLNGFLYFCGIIHLAEAR